MSKYRVGMIGVGGIAAGVHIPAWMKHEEVELVALADVNPDRAKKLASEIGNPKVVEVYKELLAMELDMVDICVPSGLHEQVVIETLKSGKHVLCEKPLATSMSSILNIGKTVEETGKMLMTTQNRRYEPASQTLRRWVDAGNLGDPYHAKVYAMRRAWLPTSPGFINPALSGGGPCMDIGIHALDLCLWLMNFPTPVRVSGVKRVNFAHGYEIGGLWGEWDRAAFQVEDFASGYVVFENGASMALEMSWLGHQNDRERMGCEIFGTKGRLTWPEAETTQVRGLDCHAGKFELTPSKLPLHELAIRDFVNAVKNNLPSPIPWSDSFRSIAILEGIYQSAEKGGEIDLRPAMAMMGSTTTHIAA